MTVQLFWRHKKMIICPHCQTKGYVYTKLDEVTKGISGGKAVGGLLTGGLSLLATGISRKQQVTRCKCRNCGSEWMF